jgi:CSLREA domain-containing protein
VAAAVVLACALPAAAGAQVVVVNTAADTLPAGPCDLTPGGCTLREAIEQSSATEIQLPQATYSLEDVPLVISRPLTIRGIDDELVTIAGNSETQDRVITIGPEIAVQLFRLRIEGGNEEDPPGGFPDEGLGGALYVPVSSSLAVTDSEIVNNRAVSGGGIWSAGPLTLTRTTVADNVAFGVGAGLGLGGGVALNNTSTPVTFTNTTFGRNEAFGFGGGIYTERPMTMRSVSIVENEAPVPDPDNHGGGLHQVFTPGEQTVASNTLVALNVGGGCGCPAATSPPTRATTSSPTRWSASWRTTAA